ncbi:hypothetical protein JCM19233_5584 [Vibrio astriarenae]|nr:hypothetical protein JCM19233_5584 [Vibrio sp. C7]
MEVTSAVLTDITVTPATVTVAKGQTEQLTATVSTVMVLHLT